MCGSSEMGCCFCFQRYSFHSKHGQRSPSKTINCASRERMNLAEGVNRPLRSTPSLLYRWKPLFSCMMAQFNSFFCLSLLGDCPKSTIYRQILKKTPPNLKILFDCVFESFCAIVFSVVRILPDKYLLFQGLIAHKSHVMKT